MSGAKVRNNERRHPLDMYDLQDQLRGGPIEQDGMDPVTLRRLCAVGVLLFWVGVIWLVVHYADVIDGFGF